MASEHSDWESLSAVSTGSPLFQVKRKNVGCVSSRVQREALANLWLKNEQNCRFRHFHCLNLLLVHVLHVLHAWMVATLKGGGSQLPRGGE